MIGKAISEHLVNIETVLWQWEADKGLKPYYTDEGFRAACKIFMSALMDMMWDKQDYDKTELNDRVKMAESAGNELRKLVFTYTGIDTHKLYEKAD